MNKNLTAISAFVLATMLSSTAVLGNTGTMFEFENAKVTYGKYWINDAKSDSGKNLELATAGVVEFYFTPPAEGIYDIEFRYKTGDITNPSIALGRYHFYLNDDELILESPLYNIVEEPSTHWTTWASRDAKDVRMYHGEHKMTVSITQEWGTLDYFKLTRKDGPQESEITENEVLVTVVKENNDTNSGSQILASSPDEPQTTFMDWIYGQYISFVSSVYGNIMSVFSF